MAFLLMLPGLLWLGLFFVLPLYQLFEVSLQSRYPGYPGSLVQKFMDLMISYLAPIVLGIVVVVTILNRFLGISILGLQ